MIIISPFSKQMRNGQPHPKNYPRWREVIELLQAQVPQHLVQVGIREEEQLVPDKRDNLPLVQLAELVGDCDTWISVDNFFQHFCWDLRKPGVAIFGQSDPLIFGHPENVNLLKDRRYLRPQQFWMWEQASFNAEAFVEPAEVVRAVTSLLPFKLEETATSEVLSPAAREYAEMMVRDPQLRSSFREELK